MPIILNDLQERFVKILVGAAVEEASFYNSVDERKVCRRVFFRSRLSINSKNLSPGHGGLIVTNNSSRRYGGERNEAWRATFTALLVKAHCVAVDDKTVASPNDQRGRRIIDNVKFVDNLIAVKWRDLDQMQK